MVLVSGLCGSCGVTKNLRYTIPDEERGLLVPGSHRSNKMCSACYERRRIQRLRADQGVFVVRRTQRPRVPKRKLCEDDDDDSDDTRHVTKRRRAAVSTDETEAADALKLLCASKSVSDATTMSYLGEEEDDGNETSVDDDNDAAANVACAKKTPELGYDATTTTPQQHEREQQRCQPMSRHALEEDWSCTTRMIGDLAEMMKALAAQIERQQIELTAYITSQQSLGADIVHNMRMQNMLSYTICQKLSGT